MKLFFYLNGKVIRNFTEVLDIYIKTYYDVPGRVGKFPDIFLKKGIKL